jgi:midasin
MSITTNSAHSLLEKYLYTINILPLSRTELAEIICKNYPKLSTVSKRIVDVFLTFSSGCHNDDETVESEMDLMKKSRKKKKQNGKSEEADDVLPYLRHVSTTNLPNSGRMVSTRDLLKLCKRSNPSFQVTSTECAYFVFQNCVDLFCSHLPAGEVKTDLIVSIGARLGIIESRCIHLSNEVKPTVTMTSDDISVGRVKLGRNSKENHQKKMRIDDDESDDETTPELIKKRSPPPTFSFTRISSCILERIAVSVDQNEPVLLVGETGVGKTSSIQYLAYQTNHKLVVVNMNNQSDVSDLIGGFKPVDIGFVISPLRIEFEHLFV